MSDNFRFGVCARALRVRSSERTKAVYTLFETINLPRSALSFISAYFTHPVLRPEIVELAGIRSWCNIDIPLWTSAINGYFTSLVRKGVLRRLMTHTSHFIRARTTTESILHSVSLDQPVKTPRPTSRPHYHHDVSQIKVPIALLAERRILRINGPQSVSSVSVDGNL